MAKLRREHMPRKVELALDRERIMKADPISFLSDVMAGKPVEELDWEGEVIGFQRPTVDHRVVAARELLKKVVPDLKSVDVTADGGAGVTFQFHSPVALPNSQQKLQADPDALSSGLHRIEDAIEVHDDDD